MSIESLQGLRPSPDAAAGSGTAAPSLFRLPPADDNVVELVRPLARPAAAPKAPDYEGVQRLPLVQLLSGDSLVTVESQPGLFNLRARVPLVSGDSAGVDAIAGLRQQGDQSYLDAGLRVSAKTTGGALAASGAVELVGSSPLGGDPSAGYGAVKAEGRVQLGDAFVSGLAEASTLPDAPVKIETSAGVVTPVGALSVNRNWNAGDSRADTSVRLTNGDLRIEAGRDDRIRDTYLRVNLRARF